MNHYHNNAAHVYVGFLNEKPVCFFSIIHFPHASGKNYKRGHRFVVLPDFQGIGIGMAFRDFICSHYLGNNITSTTSSISLIKAMNKSKNWKLQRYGRTAKQGKTSTRKYNAKSKIQRKRKTATFKFVFNDI